MTPREAIARALSRHFLDKDELEHWVDKFIEDLQEADGPDGPGFAVGRRVLDQPLAELDMEKQFEETSE